jgi:hypothetical protein
MPIVTKKYLSDQILYKIYGGTPDSGAPIDERDIWARIEQRINSQYKMQHFAMSLPSGETVPENLAIGTYENVAVVSSGYVSYADLPVMPISLPRNAGIQLVYDPNNPENSFIPILNGQRQLLKTDALLSDMLGQISYSPSGKRVTFSKDITLLNVPVVTMELVVMDIGQYGETDMLPVPADFVDGLIMEIYKEYLPVTPESGKVENFTNANQKSNP